MRTLLFLYSFFIFNLYATTSFNSFKGMVEVPKLFGKKTAKYPPGTLEVVKGELKFFQEPKKESQVLLKLTDKNKSELLIKLGKREFEYEYSGLEVYGVSGEWYQVEVKELDFIKKNNLRYVWISKGDTEKFHPYANLLKSSITYLDPKNWNGRFFKEPNIKSEVKIKNLNVRNNVEVNVINQKNDFFQVEIYTSNECEDDTPKKIGTFWVPVTNLKGRPNIWYYARGC